MRMGSGSYDPAGLWQVPEESRGHHHRKYQLHIGGHFRDKTVTRNCWPKRAFRPGQGVACGQDSAIALARDLGYPVVVNPITATRKGVTLNITSDEQLFKAYQLASAISHKVIVERQIEGSNYRVLVVGTALWRCPKGYPLRWKGTVFTASRS